MISKAKMHVSEGQRKGFSDPRHTILAELSILHELSGLAFAESEEQLAREAVEKVTRLFGARCFAVLCGGFEQRRLFASSGFSTLEEARAKLEELSGHPCLLQVVFNQDSVDEDVIFFEHTTVPNEQTRRLYTVFARRLEDKLSAFRLLARNRRAEKAVRENEQMLRKSQEAAGIGSYSLDLVHSTWKGSKVLHDLLGLDPGRDNTRDQWQALILPEWRTKVMLAQEHALKNLERFEQEYKIIRKGDGRERWMHDMGRFETDGEGRPVRLVGTIMDITERKKAEEEREKLQEQLNQAQKMDSVGQLAGGVAHDFNNMLSVILGYAELALGELSPSHSLHDKLTQIHQAATRSADITRQLLAFARKQTIAPKVLQLNEVIENTLKVLQRLIGENIDLVWLPGSGMGPVRIDPSQVDQILTNLCINSRDAITTTGRITIETGTTVFDETHCPMGKDRFPGEFVFLSVSDDGCGMSRETLANVFEPFFTTKAMGSGSGLGLSTIYGIVKQNEGFVGVHSEPGKGATFKIYLPLYAGEMPLEGGQHAQEAPRSLGETVLVVEDEVSILELVDKMLYGLGYNVLTANSPELAIRMSRERTGNVHLLITDVVMPHMSGRSLSKELGARWPHLRTLYMSGYTANVIAQEGVLHEGVHFIQKPFSLQELALKIREALK